LQDPWWSSFPHHIFLHIVPSCIMLKDVRHNEQLLVSQKYIHLHLHTFFLPMPLGIATSINTNAHNSHNTNQTIANHEKLSFFFLCWKPQKMPPLVEPRSFIYMRLLILPKPQAPIRVTFVRTFMKNKNQPRWPCKLTS
jgi:hypothetical protein